MHTLASGTVVGAGRYQLGRRLGEGGLGVVHEARDRDRDELVALKMLKRKGAESLFQLKQEFRNLVLLRHPNLAALYDLFVHDEEAFFTMELVRGVDFLDHVLRPAALPVRGTSIADDALAGAGPGDATLSDAPVFAGREVARHSAVGSLRQSVDGLVAEDAHIAIGAAADLLDETIPSGEAGDILPVASALDAPVNTEAPPPPELVQADLRRLRDTLVQLLDGLDALHAAGHIHRDIKPSNVLVEDGGRVVILDFGLTVNRRELARSSLAGVPAGTIAYMAPEQAAGVKELSPASDLYAVGVMWYEALVGRLPAAGPAMQILLRRAASFGSEASLVSDEALVGAPEAWRSLIVDLLRGDPARRPTVRDLREALLGWSAGADDAGPARQRVAGRLESSSTPSTSDGTSLASALAPVETVFGRVEERRRLRIALRPESDQNSRLRPVPMVFVEAPAGLGKSTLCASLLDELEADGYVCLRARCFERESVPFRSFDGVIDDLSRLLKGRMSKEVGFLAPRHLHALLRLFPVLARVPEVVEAAEALIVQNLSVAEQQHQALSAVRELFERLSTRYPVVIYIDDAHFVDAPTVELIREIASTQDAGSRLSFLFSTWAPEARGGELTRGERALRELAQSPGSEKVVVPLGPLSLDEAEALAASLLRRSRAPLTADDVPRAIARAADGHPLFVLHLAQHVHRGGSVTGASLSDVLAGAIAELEPTERHALALLSISTEPVEQRALQLSVDAPKARFLRIVEGLQAGRLVRAVATDGELRFEPYHRFVREAIAKAQSEAERRIHHLALASALLTLTEPPAARLTDHYRLAGRTAEAFEWSLKAAEFAQAGLDYVAAAQYLELALELQPDLEASSRAALMQQAADCCAMVGRNEDAAAHLQGAASLVESLRDSVPASLHPEHLSARAAMQLLQAGAIDRAMPLVQQAFSRLGLTLPASGSTALVSYLLWQRRLHGEVRALESKADARRALVQRAHGIDPLFHRRIEALDIWSSLILLLPMQSASLSMESATRALRAGLPDYVVAYLGHAAGGAAYQGQLAWAQRLLDLAARIGDVEDPLARAASEAGKVAVQLHSTCDWQSVVTAFEQQMPVYFAQGGAVSPHYYGTLHTYCYCLFYLGRIDTLFEHTAEELRRAARSKNRIHGGVMAFHHTLACLLRDDAASATRWLTTIGELAHAGFHPRLWHLIRRADVARYTGDDSALAQLEPEARRISRSLLMKTPVARGEALLLRAHNALVRAELAQDVSRRRRLLARAFSLGRRMTRLDYPSGQPLGSLVLAGAEMLSGRPIEAVSLMQKVLPWLEARGARLHVHAARYRIAQCHQQVAEEARDQVALDQARSLLDASSQGLASLGVRNPERALRLVLPG